MDYSTVSMELWEPITKLRGLTNTVLCLSGAPDGYVDMEILTSSLYLVFTDMKDTLERLEKINDQFSELREKDRIIKEAYRS